MTLPDDVVEKASQSIFDIIWPLQDWDGEETTCRRASGIAARAALEAARYGELVEAVAAFRCAIVAPADAKTIDEADKRLAALLSTIGATQP